KLQEQQSKNKELITDIKVKNLELQESNETIDTLMCVSQTYKANDLAKELGFKSANAFNEKLKEMKIQYKQGGDWYFYSQYSFKGYDILKQYILPSGAVHCNRRFTQAGRAFILALFKDVKNK
ncbi:MAG: phage antirepressor KilAC domain-containing protein, partial [Bacteroidales bacterium]